MKKFKERLSELRRADLNARYPEAMKTGAFDFRYEVKAPKSAAQMEKLIVEFLKLKGHHAQKVTTTGVYRDNRKVVTDAVGFQRTIGSGTWTSGTSTKGAADIQSVIHGISFSIEVKFSKGDRQRPEQKKFEADVKRAGGQYHIVRDLDEFLELYDKIMESDQVKLMKEFTV